MDYINFNYNYFSDETKKFLNKAMDIYATVKDMDIKFIRNISKLESELSIKEKIGVSLFIAGFLTDGKLKEILERYDDIKLSDLLSFINISEEQFCKLNTDEYSNFYSINFKIDLINIVNDGSLYEKINFITPEVIVYYLLNDSNVFYNLTLWRFFDEKTNISFFHEHPFYKSLKSYNLANGSLSRKESPKSNISSNFTDFSILFPDIKKNNIINPNKNFDKQETFTQEVSTTKFNSDKIWLLLDEIQKKFIGQERTVEDLFYNIVNNQQLAEMENIPDGQRSIIFLDGPTGTGKTAITREITEKLDIPFTASSITNYSSTGYVGGNITDTLKELIRKANGDLKKAQRGIVVFDEFDKIAYSREGGLEMKKAVQQQLLDFLGGGKYTIRVGDSFFDRKEVEFDTSKLTFVCLGALSDLRAYKTERKHPIGFGQSVQQGEKQEYTILPQDLIGLGLERELVGRFNTYLHTDDYSLNDLIRILKESTISPLIGFRQWIELNGKKLEVDDDVYSLIAEQAYALNTGARSLQTVMNNIRTSFIKEVLRGTNKTIHLDSETVKRINSQTMNRKGRG